MFYCITTLSSTPIEISILFITLHYTSQQSQFINELEPETNERARQEKRETMAWLANIGTQLHFQTRCLFTSARGFAADAVWRQRRQLRTPRPEISGRVACLGYLQQRPPLYGVRYSHSSLELTLICRRALAQNRSLYLPSVWVLLLIH